MRDTGQGSSTHLRTPFFASLLLASIASPALAQDQDQQLWFKLAAGTDLSEQVDLGFETNQRIGNDEGGIFESQYLAKISVDLGGVKLTGGINRVVSISDGRVSSTEWRPRQEIGFPVATLGRGGLAARVRLEQRFRSDGDDVGHRVRPEVTYALPLTETLDLELAQEHYFNLNTTDFGQRSGHERMRNSIGLTFPIGSTVDAEIGYLNQYRFNRNARDRMEHALTTGLSVKF